MGRVLTVTYVFLLLGIQPFVDIPAEREVQSVSADVEQTEEIRPKIALTFDDGPSAAYTEKLLDGLRERDVHATFFLIGENIEKGDNKRANEVLDRMFEIFPNEKIPLTFDSFPARFVPRY